MWMFASVVEVESILVAVPQKMTIAAEDRTMHNQLELGFFRTVSNDMYFVILHYHQDRLSEV